MKKHAIDRRRAAAEPVSVRRTSDRPRPADPERSDRRRPRRHDNPFRAPEADDPRDSRSDPARTDRHLSRNQLRTWEKGWAAAEPEDDAEA